MTKQELMSFMLPTGFYVIDTDISLIKPNIEYVSFNSFRTLNEAIRRKTYKLILRPLSDLNGDEGVGFELIQKAINIKNNGDWLKLMANDIKIDELPFYLIQLLISFHFDIFGLIEKGEAVDYHTLPDFVF